MDTAARLAAHLDTLASSLTRSGAPPAEAQRLLASASLATLQAVSLNMLTASRQLGQEPPREHKAPVLEPVPAQLAA